MQESDKDFSVAWFDAPFPADPTRAETFIKDEHKSHDPRSRHFIVALNEDDTIVGRIMVWANGRIAEVWFHMNPVRDDIDTLQAEILDIVVPWLADEASMLCVTVAVASDQPETIAAAETHNMVPSVRLREFFARPGHRVDLIYYQALGQAWTFPEEVANA
jgi:RimJ/RimL family protein N-acetyltransferase